VPSLKIEGADQLQALAKALKDAGAKGLRKELMRSAQRATKPVKREVPASARRYLPRQGGLGVWVAGAKLKTKTRTAGRNVGVVITGTAGRRMSPSSDLRAINRGRVRHPTYGHRPWVNQQVRPGFWDVVMEGPVSDRARAEFVDAMDRIARQIASSV
jgi:hypothetical protein